MTDTLSLSWLTLLVGSIVLGAGFTLGAFAMNAVLNVARRGGK